MEIIFLIHPDHSSSFSPPSMSPGGAYPFRDVLLDGGIQTPPRAPEEDAFLHPLSQSRLRNQGLLFLTEASDISGTATARIESCVRDGEASG